MAAFAGSGFSSSGDAGIVVVDLANALPITQTTTKIDKPIRADRNIGVRGKQILEARSKALRYILGTAGAVFYNKLSLNVGARARNSTIFTFVYCDSPAFSVYGNIKLVTH